MNPDQIMIVYITCVDTDEARQIARALVEERLAASVNISQHETVYHWQGVLVDGAEAAMIAKTTAAKYDDLEARVRQLSSYMVPCIIAWPIERGLARYVEWARGELEE
ncbi:MAG TPA: divalent-cation tolerance protein CutA [Acetobacteraceae bacterium]|nr:divalent-cation tolerance protein CutA [Acetobacteraceae bacterium]